MFCIHSSAEEYLCCFQLLAIINKAAVNIVEHVYLLYDGASLGYISRNGIAGYSGRIISNFLRNHQTDSKVVLLTCSPTHSGGVLLSPHPC